MQPARQLPSATQGRRAPDRPAPTGSTAQPARRGRDAAAVAALPKTRSAKIVRGAIKRIYLGEDPDNIDTSSIEVPEFLMATLLLLTFSVVWVQWFPAGGLRSTGADEWAFFWQLLDFLWHLALPVFVMSIGPLVMVTRFVRDAVARASAAPFVISLRALGVEPKTVNRRLLRHGAVPVATLTGGLLPLLVGGSIIVENLFSLDGLGHLAFRAVLGQDQAIVMALVLLTSTVTLLALLISDLMHRLVDNRVRLMD